MPSTEAEFVHQDPDFGALLRIVAAAVGVQEALVEKDYWVTHAMWALEAAGFRVHLKGGTERASLAECCDALRDFARALNAHLASG